ncbi:MAG: Predicted beta-glucoside-regulated ABC transport system, permease component 1, COG1175 [uncultured Thermomicrobiales bacterium]|uniref:Predicted beta-glucoside-regulated ABC transport system, permease component 1, COG1175 n=1 Tax=uncultured Thermomicrobiales bacterium TaxID=1645740 RepID=A0A6J4U739_9BACT|nr:MAG: Predicted beta-glucoside-regulated ABC transport system, permease component 1, COG1175 [uncultured Thermomicrobiales bacterium]
MAAQTTEPLQTPKGSRFGDRLIAPVLLAPSVIALLIFVYGFIGTTVWISLSNWRSASPDWSLADPLFSVYDRLFNTPRFQTDLRNTIIFTVLFLVVAVGAGLLFALLLDQKFPGSVLFRNIFLFPYALSFIVTGVAWRWIFNPETGINILFDTLGINWLLAQIGLGPFQPRWLTNPEVAGDLRTVIPGLDGLFTQLGVPLAMLPVVIAAAWQLSGFAMAMYLAGLSTISGDIREAAQLDGASGWQIYRQIIIPLLKPVTISTMIILGHVSLKIFDLIFAMSGSGPGFATDVPGIFIIEQTFRANRYDLGAAAAIVMLMLVALIIVPYLIRSMRDL